jgi:hypothetical protein
MRERRVAAELIERVGLDLPGLGVVTEAATGPYLAHPVHRRPRVDVTPAARRESRAA